MPANININFKPQRFWVLWMLFFFQYAAVGVYFTFLNVYYKEVGLSGTQIGLISMAGGMVGMASSFLWGYLSDRTGKPSLLIAVGALGALLTAQLIPLVHAYHLPNAVLFYVVIGCLGNLFNASCFSLVDSTALAILGERRSDYGRYRLGGSVGYILAAVMAGFLYDRLDMVWMFPIYALLMLLFALLALALPPRTVRLESSGGREILQMIRQPAWLIFVAVIFLFWVSYNASLTFIGIILKTMGATDQLISFAIVIGAIIEIPFMAFSGGLIKRFGAVKLMWFAIILQIVRYVLLSQMQAPAWAIAINTLNGPGFVLFWNSALNYGARLVPAKLIATAQGAYIAATSLAGIISSLLSGVVFDQLGPSRLFLVMALFCGVGFIILTFGILLRPQARATALDSAGH